MEDKGYFDSLGEQEVSERSWTNPDMRAVFLDMNILKPTEMTLMVLREQSEGVDLNTRNLARKGSNLERARRIPGMTTKQIFTEDMVTTASRDSCQGSWHYHPPC